MITEFKSKEELINHIIENEFQHISEYKEGNFIDRNEEQKRLDRISRDAFERLNSHISIESKGLLEEYHSSTIYEWTNMCKFYFEEGVKAGITNLSFLKGKL